MKPETGFQVSEKTSSNVIPLPIPNVKGAPKPYVHRVTSSNIKMTPEFLVSIFHEGYNPGYEDLSITDLIM
jgi:hypothetical protein